LHEHSLLSRIGKEPSLSSSVDVSLLSALGDNDAARLVEWFHLRIISLRKSGGDTRVSLRLRGCLICRITICIYYNKTYLFQFFLK